MADTMVPLLVDLRPIKEFSKRLRDAGLRKSIQQEPDFIDSETFAAKAAVWLAWVESTEAKSK